MIPLKRLLLALPPLLFLSFSPTSVTALGQQQVVCFDAVEGAFPLVSGSAAAILVSEEDSNGVKRAGKSHLFLIAYFQVTDQHFPHPSAATFARDVANVTGQHPDVLHELDAAFNSSGSHVVVVGSVGSPFVTTLVNAGAMNVSDIEGRWESFKIQVVDGSSIGVETALVVVGAESVPTFRFSISSCLADISLLALNSQRGTIYGVYDLSEQIGVSPWHWWADVRIPHHGALYIKILPYVHGSPTVKYRGTLARLIFFRLDMKMSYH